MPETAHSSTAGESRSVGAMQHLSSGSCTGITCGLIVGTVLAICITVWNELQPPPYATPLLVFAYLTFLYVAFFGVVGVSVGTATALLSRLLSRKLDRPTVTAAHAAIIGGGACFVYTARKLTYGLYFSDHPSFTSYRDMVAFYLFLVGLFAALAALAAALTFFAVRSLLRRTSGRMLVGTFASLCGLIFAAVLVGQALVGAENVRAAAAAPRPVDTSTSPGNGRKVLVIGLDGATWDVLEPLIEQGKVPWLTRLARDGATASLATMTPTLSPILWTTIATGMRPEKHGIYAFAGMSAPGIDFPIQRIPGFVGLAETLPGIFPGLVGNHLVGSTRRKAKALWNIVGEQGRRVGVVNWYVSYPAERVPGAMISDRTYEFLTETPPASVASEEPYTYPETLIADLTPLIHSDRDFVVTELESFVSADADEIHALLNKDRNGPVSTLRFHYLADTFYRDAANMLRERLRPDLMVLYLKGIDRIEHHFWKWREPRYFPDVSADEARKFGDVIDRYYEFTDALLGGVLRQVDPDTTVFVISDHGHGPAFNTEGLSGNHSNAPDGIFIAHGPNIRPGARLARASVLDITPTVLAAMGHPVARDMDGRPLTDVFTAGFLKESPIRSIETYGSPQGVLQADADTPLDEGIKERLRSLGYLK